MGKDTFDSKTIWFGVIQILLALAGGLPEIVAAVQKSLEAPPEWSDVGQVVPWVLMLVSGVVTILLRRVTTQPLK
jgi:hypothetical protein